MYVQGTKRRKALGQVFRELRTFGVRLITKKRVRISACVTTRGRRNDLWTISSGQGRVEVNSEKYCLFPYSIPVRTTEKSSFQL